MDRTSFRTVMAVSVLFLTGLLCLPSSASADDIVQWTVAGTFTTGTGTVGGFFDFDFTTGTYTTIDITTTPGTNNDGTANPGHTYTSLINPSVGVGSGTGGFLFGNPNGDLTGSAWLMAGFTNELTPSGGTISIDFMDEGTCTDAVCGTQGLSFREDSGTVTAPIVSTPEPSALSLLGLGCLGLLLVGAVNKLLVA